MIEGRKSVHSTKALEFAALAGEFHSDTSQRQVMAVIRAIGECAYFILFIECPIFLTCMIYYSDRHTAETVAESSIMPQFCRPTAKWRHNYCSSSDCFCCYIYLGTFYFHMDAKPSFAHRLQIAKMAYSFTSAQNNGYRVGNNRPRELCFIRVSTWMLMYAYAVFIINSHALLGSAIFATFYRHEK